MRAGQTPTVAHEKGVCGPVFNVGGQFQRFTRAARRVDKFQELQGLAPKVIFLAPFDVFLAARVPVGDAGENGSGGWRVAGFPEISHDRLACGKPVLAMDRHWEIGMPHVLAEGEECAMFGQVILGVLNAFVHFDLLHAGITFDIEHPVVALEVFIEFLGAADIQDGIRISVEFEDFLLLQPDTRIIRQKPCAIAPATLESELGGEFSQHLGGIRVVLVHGPSDRIVGQAGGVFDVVDLVPEPLQAHNIMHVLPDHPSDGAPGREAHDNDLFAFHNRWLRKTAMKTLTGA